MKLNRVILNLSNQLRLSQDQYPELGTIKNKGNYVPLSSVLSIFPSNSLNWGLKKIINNPNLSERELHPKLKKKMGVSKSILEDNLIQFCLYKKRLDHIDHVMISKVRTQYQEWLLSNEISTKISNQFYSRPNLWLNVLNDFNSNFEGFTGMYNLANVYLGAGLGIFFEINTEFTPHQIQDLYCILMVKKEFIPIIKAGFLFGYEFPGDMIEAWVLNELDTPEFVNQTLRGAWKTGILKDLEDKGITIVTKTRQELKDMWVSFYEPKFRTPDERKAFINSVVTKFLEKEKLDLGITKIKPKFNFAKVRTGIVKSNATFQEVGEQARQMTVEPITNDYLPF